LINNEYKHDVNPCHCSSDREWSIISREYEFLGKISRLCTNCGKPDRIPFP
jgi:hypothetical protein